MYFTQDDINALAVVFLLCNTTVTISYIQPTFNTNNITAHLGTFAYDRFWLVEPSRSTIPWSASLRFSTDDRVCKETNCTELDIA